MTPDDQPNPGTMARTAWAIRDVPQVYREVMLADLAHQFVAYDLRRGRTQAEADEFARQFIGGVRVRLFLIQAQPRGHG